MSSLVRKFFLFVAVLGILFATAFVSFRCGRSQGLVDAPRHFYSVDVSRALRDNPQFRQYVDSLYVSTYRSAIDSILHTERVVGLVAHWLSERPGCVEHTFATDTVGVREFRNFFFKSR